MKLGFSFNDSEISSIEQLLPPACFAAFSKLAAAPAVGSLEVDNTATPLHDQWEADDNKDESVTSTEKPVSDVD